MKNQVLRKLVDRKILELLVTFQGALEAATSLTTQAAKHHNLPQESLDVYRDLRQRHREQIAEFHRLEKQDFLQSLGLSMVDAADKLDLSLFPDKNAKQEPKKPARTARSASNQPKATNGQLRGGLDSACQPATRRNGDKRGGTLLIREAKRTLETEGYVYVVGNGPSPHYKHPDTGNKIMVRFPTSGDIINSRHACHIARQLSQQTGKRFVIRSRRLVIEPGVGRNNGKAHAA